MFGLPKEIAGTIIAAVIAAAISLLGLLISKENKVSEFRQAWIDSLREEISAIVVHASAVRSSIAGEHFVPLNVAWAKVKLRLNPTEDLHIAILTALGEHEALFAGGKIPAQDALDLSDTKLLDCTKVVLKEEWERVKRGERIYRAATWLAGILIIVGVLFLLLKPCMPRVLHSATRDYRVVARTDNYVDKEGRPASEQFHDHEIVGLVFAHDGHRIYGQCDLSTLNKLDPNASCGLHPLHDYECAAGRDDIMKAPMPLSDLTCTDADGRKVYVYVSKEE
jgi:hypothetical protein